MVKDYLPKFFRTKKKKPNRTNLNRLVVLGSLIVFAAGSILFGSNYLNNRSNPVPFAKASGGDVTMAPGQTLKFTVKYINVGDNATIDNASVEIVIGKKLQYIPGSLNEFFGTDPQAKCINDNPGALLQESPNGIKISYTPLSATSINSPCNGSVGGGSANIPFDSSANQNDENTWNPQKTGKLEFRAKLKEENNDGLGFVIGEDIGLGVGVAAKVSLDAVSPGFKYFNIQVGSRPDATNANIEKVSCESPKLVNSNTDCQIKLTGQNTAGSLGGSVNLRIGPQGLVKNCILPQTTTNTFSCTSVSVGGTGGDFNVQFNALGSGSTYLNGDIVSVQSNGTFLSNSDINTVVCATPRLTGQNTDCTITLKSGKDFSNFFGSITLRVGVNGQFKVCNLPVSGNALVCQGVSVGQDPGKFLAQFKASGNQDVYLDANEITVNPASSQNEIVNGDIKSLDCQSVKIINETTDCTVTLVAEKDFINLKGTLKFRVNSTGIVKECVLPISGKIMNCLGISVGGEVGTFPSQFSASGSNNLYVNGNNVIVGVDFNTNPIEKKDLSKINPEQLVVICDPNNVPVNTEVVCTTSYPAGYIGQFKWSGTFVDLPGDSCPVHNVNGKGGQVACTRKTSKPDVYTATVVVLDGGPTRSDRVVIQTIQDIEVGLSLNNLSEIVRPNETVSIRAAITNNNNAGYPITSTITTSADTIIKKGTVRLATDTDSLSWFPFSLPVLASDEILQVQYPNDNTAIVNIKTLNPKTTRNIIFDVLPKKDEIGKITATTQIAGTTQINTAEFEKFGIQRDPQATASFVENGNAYVILISLIILIALYLYSERKKLSYTIFGKEETEKEKKEDKIEI